MGQVNYRFMISLNVEQCIARGTDNTCMLYYTEVFFLWLIMAVICCLEDVNQNVALFSIKI